MGVRPAKSNSDSSRARVADETFIAAAVAMSTRLQGEHAHLLGVHQAVLLESAGDTCGEQNRRRVASNRLEERVRRQIRYPCGVGCADPPDGSRDNQSGEQLVAVLMIEVVRRKGRHTAETTAIVATRHRSPG